MALRRCQNVRIEQSLYQLTQQPLLTFQHVYPEVKYNKNRTFKCCLMISACRTTERCYWIAFSFDRQTLEEGFHLIEGLIMLHTQTSMRRQHIVDLPQKFSMLPFRSWHDELTFMQDNARLYTTNILIGIVLLEYVAVERLDHQICRQQSTFVV